MIKFFLFNLTLKIICKEIFSQRRNRKFFLFNLRLKINYEKKTSVKEEIYLSKKRNRKFFLKEEINKFKATFNVI